MRVKISFLRVQDANHSVPLHHQKLVSAFIDSIIDEIGSKPKFYNFSSLKGTSKVQNGFMRFMSSKISLVVSSRDSDFIQAFIKKMFDKPVVQIGKLNLVPKSHEIIEMPDFDTVVKYVCISPLVVADPDIDEENSQASLDPASQEFSDLLYDAVVSNMEKAGFLEAELNTFAEFEAIPDKAYVEKINQSGKKYARTYKTNEDKLIMGYLLPFTLHAHRQVHEFIWNSGLGVLNTQGYGMIDLAKE
jgi:CRISPR-associated endoribonuclease Cas6